MNRDPRNTKVVICLILAMTAGVQILLWLEPRSPRSEPLIPLTAVDGLPIEDVRIEYADATRLDEVDARSADCVIQPDGQCDWRPGGPGPHVRLVVAGSGTANTLAAAQKASLLNVLHSMAQARGGKAVSVSLQRDSDSRETSQLPAEARDLRELLVWKGMIQ